ncbi:UNVERIFIED_CONTAM: hypothetical protein FKN15_072370 [Acipenser sinensis]
MDVSVSVSFFQDELASTIEHAVKAAVDTVLCEITKVVGGKFTEFQMEMAGKEKENESLKLRLEISESELKAVRECMNAADADIKQPLRNMNPDCNEQDFQRNENQGLFQDPKESHAVPKSEAQEGPRIEAVYTQEESFDQEWCASLKQVTELTCVKDEEDECVPIKEEFLEQECFPIAEEVPTENNVCTLEENTLGSSLCDDCPPEYELGFRACNVDEGEHDSTPSPHCKNSSSGKPHHKKCREKIPQEEHFKTLRVQIPSVQDRQLLTLESIEPAHSLYMNNSETWGNFLPCSTQGGKSSCQLGSLKTHKRNNTRGTAFPCAVCGKSFSCLSHLKRHQLSHTGEKPYECNECEKRFSQLPHLKNHLRIHTGEKPYHCNVCGKRFTELGSLKRHKRIHTEELASTIEHAVKAAVDTVLCEITKVVGGKFTEFQMEMSGKEKENESLKLRLEISESELKAVRECMNAADADIKQPLRNMNPDCNEQDFQRNENQRLFKGAGVKLKQRWGMEPVHKKEEATELEPVHIKHHQQIHKSKKLYHCNECGRSFTQFGNLKIHKQVHTVEKRYKCNECSQSFTKLQCLKKHQRTHTGEKPYHCNECEKSFAVIGNLKKHQHIHKGEKPYHCTECEKTFSDLGNLKKHNRVHKGEKPYHCIECGKRFIQLGHLKKHQQIHLGDKPYHCTECKHCSLKPCSCVYFSDNKLKLGAADSNPAVFWDTGEGRSPQHKQTKPASIHSDGVWKRRVGEVRVEKVQRS